MVPGKSYSIAAGGKTVVQKASDAGSILIKDVKLAHGQSVQIREK